MSEIHIKPLNLKALKKSGDTEISIGGIEESGKSDQIIGTQNPPKFIVSERIIGPLRAIKSSGEESHIIPNDAQLKSKLSFSQITGVSDNREQEKKNEDAIQKEEKTQENEEKPEEKITFHNYESKFKQESQNVLKRIQNFKYTPKTRTGFLISLIGLTSFGIGILMILVPEKHSLSVYKASIIEIYAGKENISIPQEITQVIPIEEEIISVEENKNPENEQEIEENEDVIKKEEETNSEELGEENTDKEEGKIKTEEEQILEKIEGQKMKVRNHLLEKYIK